MWKVFLESSTILQEEQKNLIMMDDLMDGASKSLKVTQMFTRGRYDNLSVIYLTQNLFHKNQRALSLNSDYMVIFTNSRDNSQFSTIAKQIRPDKVKFLMWTYKDATSSRERLRVRSNILEDPQHVYITY